MSFCALQTLLVGWYCESRNRMLEGVAKEHQSPNQNSSQNEDDAQPDDRGRQQGFLR